MPYIEQSARVRLDKGGRPNTVGELTYLIYKAARNLDDIEINLQIERYLNVGDPRYADYALVIGALSCASLELERRNRDYDVEVWFEACEILDTVRFNFYNQVVGPYEDKKIEENGDM